MTDNCELFSIFPSPVTKFKVPDELMTHVPSLKLRLSENPQSVVGRTIAENRYILDNLEYKNLRHWILQRVQEFASNVLTINQTMLLTQSWVNKNGPGEYTRPHSHSNSIISGILYMDVPEGNSTTIFHKPEFCGAGFNVIEPKYFTDDQHDYTYVSKVYNMPVGSSQLLMFPSWMIHSVSKNETSLDRWSLAFNSMTSGYLGDYYRLTEFLYPKTVRISEEQFNLSGEK